MIRTLPLLILAACGSPAAFDAITGTTPGSCDNLHEDVEAARVQVIEVQAELKACEEPCPELAEDLNLALLVYVQAFDDWWACAGGSW